MRAGNLDRRIDIEAYSESRNAFGDVIKSWSSHITVWADFVKKSGTEVDADKNQNHSVKGYFITRYYSTITEQMRIIYNSEYYKILELKEINRKEGWKIEVEKLQQT